VSVESDRPGDTHLAIAVPSITFPPPKPSSIPSIGVAPDIFLLLIIGRVKD